MIYKMVLICPAFLNQSETFIYEMLQRQNNFIKKVVCYDLRNEEAFPFPKEQILALRKLPFWQSFLAETSSQYNPIFNFLSGHEPDIIHAHFLISANLAEVIKNRFGGRPKLVLHVHAQDFFLPLKKGKLKYLRTNLRKADLILTPSEHVKKEIQRNFPEIQNVECYYIAIGEQNFPYREPLPLKKEVRIMMLGRMVEKKGFALGISALAEVVKRDPEHSYSLDIIGRGPLKNKLVAQVKELGLEGRVNFLTIKDNDQVLEEYRRHHIYLAPSQTAENGDKEGLPRTVTEAMALGVPVIAANHSGIPEAVLDKKTGLIFEEKNIPACAKKILWAVKNWPEMLKYSRQGREHFENLFGTKRVIRLAQKYDSPVSDFLENLEK